MKPGCTTAEAWTERYEALRRHVLNHRQNLGVDPLGLVLLLRQGVAAWMGSWCEVSSCPADSQSSCPAALPALRCPTPDWQEQLTHLLAQMTSAHLPLASAL